MHDPRPTAGAPGRCRASNPQVYAVYVDERDRVWVSDFGGNAMWSFEPRSEKFEKFTLARDSANVRQILGRKGEVWLPESGTEHIEHAGEDHDVVRHHRQRAAVRRGARQRLQADDAAGARLVVDHHRGVERLAQRRLAARVMASTPEPVALGRMNLTVPDWARAAGGRRARRRRRPADAAAGTGDACCLLLV
jgi:hypothetical protein